MARIFVESWSPEYGAPLDAATLAPAEGSVDDTVETWKARGFVSRELVVGGLFEAFLGEEHAVGKAEFFAGPKAEVDLLGDEMGAVGGATDEGNPMTGLITDTGAGNGSWTLGTTSCLG